MADPIVKKMTVFGMPIPWRVMATNGIVAWTARNHSGENFLVCSRHMPKGTFSTAVPSPSVASLTGRACGRRSLTGCNLATKARPAIIALGHCSFPLVLRGIRPPTICSKMVTTVRSGSRCCEIQTCLEPTKKDSRFRAHLCAGELPQGTLTTLLCGCCSFASHRTF